MVWRWAPHQGLLWSVQVQMGDIWQMAALGGKDNNGCPHSTTSESTWCSSGFSLFRAHWQGISASHTFKDSCAKLALKWMFDEERGHWEEWLCDIPTQPNFCYSNTLPTGPCRVRGCVGENVEANLHPSWIRMERVVVDAFQHMMLLFLGYS